jgi:hypothetical protein
MADITATVLAAQIDPGVVIDMDWLPIMTTLKETVGGILGGCIVILVGALAVATVIWAASKVSGSGRMHQFSVAAIPIILIAAVVAASANALIGWATGVTLI